MVDAHAMPSSEFGVAEAETSRGEDVGEFPPIRLVDAAFDGHVEIARDEIDSLQSQEKVGCRPRNRFTLAAFGAHALVEARIMMDERFNAVAGRGKVHATDADDDPVDAKVDSKAGVPAFVQDGLRIFDRMASRNNDAMTHRAPMPTMSEDRNPSFGIGFLKDDDVRILRPNPGAEGVTIGE